MSRVSSRLNWIVERFGDFLGLEGYAGYILTAYGLTALVLLLNWVSARRCEAREQERARRRSRGN